MYEKQICLPEIGAAGQEKLKQAKVLCVGAGGLGTPVVIYLSSCGIGTIGIVDADRVELSNLHRQPLYQMSDVGKSKVALLNQYLLDRNIGTDVHIYNEMLASHNALDLISTYDVIIDATDNFETKYVLNDACFFLKKPFITASVAAFEGSCILFDFSRHAGTPCYRCVYPAAHVNKRMSCDSLGVLGAVPGVLGLMQVIECINYLIGVDSEQLRREATLLTFDALSLDLKKFKVPHNQACLLCNGVTQYGDLLEKNLMAHALSACEFLNKLKQYGKKGILIDVRSPEEYAHHHIGGRLIPLPELENAVDQFTSDQILLVHCERGMRSKKACELFLSKGFSNVFYLNADLNSLKFDYSIET